MAISPTPSRTIASLGRFFALLLLSGLLVWTSSCQKDADINPPLDLAQLTTHTWLHSYEEDEQNVEVYRPDTYVFPASRGRTGYQFRPSSQLTYYAISPTDGMAPLPGRWANLGNYQLRITPDSPAAGPAYTVSIVSLTHDVLKIRRVE